MCAREIELRRNLLEKKVEAIRHMTPLPPDDELLLLGYRDWGKLPCSIQERMLLSAWIRLKARENGDTFALINARPKGREPEEFHARRLYQYPSGDALVHVQQLVGVLWDLIPYCEDRDARAEILSGLWPQKGHYQERVWAEMVALAAELAGTTKVFSGIDVTILPEWLNESAKTADGKSSAESLATSVAKTIAMSKIKKDNELPVAAFYNEKIRSFYDAFGRPGIKRLAGSSRPAVALVVTTDFINFKAGESDLQWTRKLLTRTEELVDYLLDQGDLSEKHLLGGPFSACVEDL